MRRAGRLSCLILALLPSAGLAAVPRPPTPRVTTLGVTRAATLVSYCWSQHSPDGMGSGVCADGVLATPSASRSLSWRPRHAIYLDLRLPAHDVTVDVVRVARSGAAPRDRVRLRVRQLGAGGRRWFVVVPRRALRANALVIGAQFDEGGLSAAIGLRPARTRPLG